MPEEFEQRSTLPESFLQQSGRNDGAMARANAEKIRTERQRLIASGLLRPHTIVNFNPISLSVEFPLIRWSVPEPEKGKKINLGWKGRKLVGSYVTIREAIVRPKIRNVQKPEGLDENPHCEYEPMSILPVEQGHLFWHEYFNGPDRTGGVLCFEGDIHVLENKPETLKVPDFVTLADRSRQYITKEVPFGEILEQVLDLQREYCDALLKKAHSMANDEDQARSITNIHRTWADFALKQGWIQQRPEWVFATVDQRDICDGCGATKKHPKAHFCVCGRPYDAFAAFMAGEDVATSYLVTLPADKLKKVKEEIAKRKKLAEELEA